MLAKLELHHNKLSGSIPGSLGRLSRLTRLNLRSNDLSGSMPGSLGRLSRLTYLNLHSNNLSGVIPDLRNTMLQELYLANNHDDTVAGSGLTGQVPAWLNGMTNMRELWLWGKPSEWHDSRPEWNDQSAEAEAVWEQPDGRCP